MVIHWSRSMGDWYQVHPFPPHCPWYLHCQESLGHLICCLSLEYVLFFLSHRTLIADAGFYRMALAFEVGMLSLLLGARGKSVLASQALWDKAVKQQWTIVRCFLCFSWSCAFPNTPSTAAWRFCGTLTRLSVDIAASRDVWTKNLAVITLGDAFLM